MISSDICSVKAWICEGSLGRDKGDRIKAVAIAIVLVLPNVCSNDLVVNEGFRRIFTAFV
jgi:hypothetical protein